MIKQTLGVLNENPQQFFFFLLLFFSSDMHH